MLKRKVMTLLGDAAKGKEDLIDLLLESAVAFAISYCRIKDYNEELDSTIVRMVIEDFNRCGGEGVAVQGFNGLTETYAEDYSQQVYKQLNRYRKIGMF